MDWQYSEPLNGALLAANNSKQVGGLGSSLYDQYYSSFDPIVSRYNARANLYRPANSLELFDEIDDLALEIEAENIFSNRNNNNNNQRNNMNNNHGPNNNVNNQLTPRTFSDSNGQFNDQIPKQPPKPNKQFQQQNQLLNGKTSNSNKSNGSQRLQQQPPGGLYNNNNSPQNLQPPQQHISLSNPNLYAYQPNFTPNNTHIQVQPHDSQHQRMLQFQNRIMQQQLQHQQQQFFNKNASGPSELEMMKAKQQQERHAQQYMHNNNNGPSQLPNVNNQKQNNFNQHNNNNNNNAGNNQFFQHFQKNKQYSETSIPSTNADPLNSNSPTPPMITHRSQRNDKKGGGGGGGGGNKQVSNHFMNSNQFLKKNSDDSQEPEFILPPIPPYYPAPLAISRKAVNLNHLTPLIAFNYGSYLNALKDARQREQRLAKDKYTANDYKTYAKNYGFGKDFLPFEFETKSEKLEKARKRDEYAKMVKERERERYRNDNNIFQTAKYSNSFETLPTTQRRTTRRN